MRRICAVVQFKERFLLLPKDAFFFSLNRQFICRNSSYVHIYFDDLVIETDKLFPLNYVEFMGVSGLGVPRDMAGFLRVVLTESALTECATGERDHRREVDFEGPMLRMPCKKLLKWLDMKE